MINTFKRLSIYLIVFYLSSGSLITVTPAQGKVKNSPKRIAILELKNMAPRLISGAEVKFLSDEIRRISRLLPSSHYSVITKENIEMLLPPDVQLEDCVGTCEVETGRMLSADYIITGELIKFGKSLRVSLKAHETRSATFLKGESAKGAGIEALETPIHRAALSLIYTISPAFQAEMEAKAGVSLDQQLSCLKDPGYCSSQTNTSQTNTSQINIPLNREIASPQPRNISTGSLHTQTPPNMADAWRKNVGTAGLYMFVTSYALTVIGVMVTDPFPGQASASFIPVLGPLRVQEINASNGDTSFEAANNSLALLQGIGLSLMALEFILPHNKVSKSSSPISLGFWSDEHSKHAWVGGRF